MTCFCRTSFLSELILVLANLVRNYSPHLLPNTRSAPPTAELRKILGMAAQDMLELLLRRRRTRRRVSESKVTQKGQDKALSEVRIRSISVYVRF